MSKAVSDRIKRCLTVVVAGYAFAAILSEAARRMMHDFLHRQREDGAGDETPEDAPAVEDLIRLAAQELEERCRAMVEADDALKRSRASLRRWRRRRDRRAQDVYDFLTTVRKFLRRLVGYAPIDRLDMSGPTPRNPTVLLNRARHAAGILADPDKEPECSFADSDDGRLKTSGMARRLTARCDRLAEALAAVTAADAAEAAALEAQRQAIADFDPYCLKTARLFERSLDKLGLPTLASSVRPGVKRRGRPAKSRPVDLFPDLVELGIAALRAIDASQVLARMVGVDNVAEFRPVEAAAGPDPARSPAEGDAAGRKAGRGVKTDDEKS